MARAWVLVVPADRKVSTKTARTLGVVSVTRKQITPPKSMENVGLVGRRGTGISNVLKRPELPRAVKPLCLRAPKPCDRLKWMVKHG